jgi:hypothetical protein
MTVPSLLELELLRNVAETQTSADIQFLALSTLSPLADVLTKSRRRSQVCGNQGGFALRI